LALCRDRGLPAFEPPITLRERRLFARKHNLARISSATISSAAKSRTGSMDKPETTPTIDVRFLELLACPLTKGPLAWDAERSELVSRLAKLAYPVRDGIPIMLPSEARVLDPEDEAAGAKRG